MSHTPPIGTHRRCRRCGTEYEITHKHESGARCPDCRSTSELPQDADWNAVMSDERDADIYVAAFDDEWKAWHRYYGGSVWRSSTWRASVRTWRRYGLDLGVLLQLVEQALTKEEISGSRWRYLCGSCWHRLREDRKIPRRKPKRKAKTRSPMTDRVYAALVDGRPLRRIELAELLGCRDDDGGLARALTAMLAKGEIVRPSRGVYDLPELPDAPSPP
jgi:hypothetical protein